MIVYHGTILSRAEMIEKSGSIERTNTKNAIYGAEEGSKRTKLGYVYVTDSKAEAFGYALNAINKLKLTGPQIAVLFEASIDQSELVLDADEMQNPTQMSNGSDKEPVKYQIGRDLQLGTDVISFARIPVDSYLSGVAFCDRLSFENDISTLWTKM